MTKPYCDDRALASAVSRALGRDRYRSKSTVGRYSLRYAGYRVQGAGEVDGDVRVKVSHDPGSDAWAFRREQAIEKQRAETARLHEWLTKNAQPGWTVGPLVEGRSPVMDGLHFHVTAKQGYR